MAFRYLVEKGNLHLWLVWSNLANLLDCNDISIGVFRTMKTVKVDLEDKEYKIALKNKKDRTWKQVVMGDKDEDKLQT